MAARANWKGKDYRGRLRTAEEVHDMSLANMSGGYCTVTTAAEVLEAIASNATQMGGVG